MNRVELWRRDRKFSQREVAQKIKATDAVVVSAEKDRPIKRAFIDAYLAAAGGFLLETDFKEAASHRPEGNPNGRTEKRRTERRVGRHR